jgi:Fic family protein
MDRLASDTSPIKLDTILSFHQAAMNTLTYGAGMIRKQNVKIRGNPHFKTIEWQLVPKMLDELFKKIEQMGTLKKKTAVQIVEEASFVHNEFQRIHPFVDGNSRTSRAIFVKYLIQNGFPLIRIPIGFSDQYMMQTKMSEKRDDKKFGLLMKQIVLINLQASNQRMDVQ